MINRLRIALAIIRPSLNFIAKRRERKLAALRAEREHQLSMLRLLASVLTKQSESTEKSVVAIAEAVRAQTDILQSWLKGFHVGPVSTETTPTRPSLDPEDLIELEAYAAARGVPPELALALSLQKKELESFDREGSDF